MFNPLSFAKSIRVIAGIHSVADGPLRPRSTPLLLPTPLLPQHPPTVPNGTDALSISPFVAIRKLPLRLDLTAAHLRIRNLAPWHRLLLRLPRADLRPRYRPKMCECHG